ncbi:hypothetical protein [Hugenholtzia roseola]|nr:hypothetical protein [Hugenholtzia roseola]
MNPIFGYETFFLFQPRFGQGSALSLRPLQQRPTFLHFVLQNRIKKFR